MIESRDRSEIFIVSKTDLLPLAKGRDFEGFGD